MEVVLIVLIVVALILVIFEIFSFFSMRKVLRDIRSAKQLDDKYFIENIVSLRSGLRGVYGGLVIVTTVLALLGIRCTSSKSSGQIWV